MLQAVEDALAGYFTKKMSWLSTVTVKALLRTTPSLDGVPVVISHYQSARTDFLKCKDLQPLLITLHPARVCEAFVLLPHISIFSSIMPPLMKTWPLCAPAAILRVSET